MGVNVIHIIYTSSTVYRVFSFLLKYILSSPERRTFHVSLDALRQFCYFSSQRNEHSTESKPIFILGNLRDFSYPGKFQCSYCFFDVS